MEEHRHSGKEEAQVKGKISPFASYPGMKAKKKRGKPLSEKQYENAMKTGEFQKVHGEILAAMYQYGYLNSFLLRQILPEAYPPEYVTRSIKWLMSNGFLMQYEFSHSEGNRESVSPRVYSLSASGQSAAKKTGQIPFCFQNPVLSKNFSIHDCLCTLAYNQFHVFFCKAFGEYAATEYYSHIWRETGIPGAYLISSKRGQIVFYVFALRQMEQWESQCLEKLRKLKSAQDRDAAPSGIVICICDMDILANEIQKLKCCEKELKAIPMYYVNDTSLMDNCGFSRLIDVPSSNGYQERRYFSFPIDSMAILRKP